VQKDLRNVLGRPEKGRYSQVYCGGPRALPRTKKELSETRDACRRVLMKTLAQAFREVARAQGSDKPADWKVYATCEDPDTVHMSSQITRPVPIRVLASQVRHGVPGLPNA